MRLIRYLFWHYLALFNLELANVFKKSNSKYICKSVMYQGKALYIYGDTELLKQFLKDLDDVEKRIKECKN